MVKIDHAHANVHNLDHVDAHDLVHANLDLEVDVPLLPCLVATPE